MHFPQRIVNLGIEVAIDNARAAGELIADARAAGREVCPHAERVLAQILPPRTGASYQLGALFFGTLPARLRYHWLAIAGARLLGGRCLHPFAAIALRGRYSQAELATLISRAAGASPSEVGFIDVLHWGVAVDEGRGDEAPPAYALGLGSRRGLDYLYAYAGFRASQPSDGDVLLVAL